MIYNLEVLKTIVHTALKYRLREIERDKQWVSGRFDAHGDWIHASEMGDSYQRSIGRGREAEGVIRQILRSTSLVVIEPGDFKTIHKLGVTKQIVEALHIYQTPVLQELSLYKHFMGMGERVWQSSAEVQYNFENCSYKVDYLEKVFGTREEEAVERMFDYLLNCRYNCN